MYTNETQCNALYLVTQCNTMETLWQLGILQKQKSWKYYFPQQQQWLAMFPSFPRMEISWSGRQTDWAHTEAESWRVKHKTTMLDTTSNHEVWRCEGGGTQRLFRKMSSTGNVVDLFQMELNGKVPKLLKQGTRTWLLQNYLVGAEVGVRNGSSALWENSEQRSQVVALLVHSCAAGQDCNVCTVQGWHSYNSGLALLLWK